jgi:hypothetical protein
VPLHTRENQCFFLIENWTKLVSQLSFLFWYYSWV